MELHTSELIKYPEKRLDPKDFIGKWEDVSMTLCPGGLGFSSKIRFFLPYVDTEGWERLWKRGGNKKRKH